MDIFADTVRDKNDEVHVVIYQAHKYQTPLLILERHEAERLSENIMESIKATLDN